MISLAIIFGVVVLLVIYLLLAPLELGIDTVHQHYYVKLFGLAKASVEPHDTKVARLHIELLFFHYYVDFLQKERKALPKKQKVAKKTKKSRTTLGLKQLIALCQSFTVKRFWLNVDTGDVVLNAELYPFFFWLDRHFGGCHINFEDKNQLIIILQNRPIRLLNIFINPKN